VSFEQGKEFAESYGMKFMETSAKTAKNVEDAFVLMTKEVVLHQKDKEKNLKKKDEETKKIDINQKKGKSIDEGKCCK